jgi:hypothetical protein
MNDKTVITQNTPHKVTVAEGSSNASRPSVTRGQGGGPSVIETPSNMQTAPVLQEAVRAFHEFDEAAKPAATGHAHFGTQAPRTAHAPVTPADPEQALLEDWSLSTELIERIDELRLQNSHIQSQLDKLATPSPKARAKGA